MTQRTRRRLLQTTASAVVATTLAGCSGDGDGQVSPTDGATDTPSVNVESLKADTRAFVERLASGEYDAAMADFTFTDAMTEQVDAAALERFWTTQTNSLGQFVEVASLEYAQSQGYHVVVARARFTEGVQLVQLVFDDRSRIAGLQFPAGGGSYSPPAYADESAFTEEDRTVDATADCSLPATLTLPTESTAGDGPVPGVVLVHGSGPNDMDETIGPNKVFTDLAWGLASEGVAVLRYDKRTHACEVDLAEVTLDEKVTDDALAALSVLRDHERVDAARTAVVGHSLGGMVAPRIASQDGTVAGVAMLAANARPLTELIVEQTEYLVNLDGSVTEAEQTKLDSIRDTVSRLESGEVESGEVVLGLGGRPFWADLADYEQVSVAQSLDVPIAVHQGARDYQVSIERDFGRWQDAIGDRDAATFHSYDELNHLFMPGEGQPNPNEYFQPGNVDAAVVENLASWLTTL